MNRRTGAGAKKVGQKSIDSNPKSECRDPKQIRIIKLYSEMRNVLLRILNFVLVSVFGFRIFIRHFGFFDRIRSCIGWRVTGWFCSG